MQKMQPIYREKSKTSEFVKVISEQFSNNWIMPYVISETYNIDIEKTFQILDKALDNHLVEQGLQIFCPVCKRGQKKIFVSIVNIPQHFRCEFCEVLVEHPLSYGVIVYKMLQEK